MVHDFNQHLTELFACRACPNVFGRPVTGAVPGARVMLVGQAPGPHEREQNRPFAYTAGKRLVTWFETLGVGEGGLRRRVPIAAVNPMFPGKEGKGGGDR